MCVSHLLCPYVKGTSSVQAKSKVVHSLDGELVLADWHAVDKLDGAPQAVELGALVHVHDAIGRGVAVPDGVVQVGLDARQHNLKHGEAAAQALAGQEVTLGRNVCLL